MDIKFDTETIRAISVFEELTNVEVRDCIIDKGGAYFVVDEGKMGLAIGKQGKTIAKVQDKLDKKVSVYEYSRNVEDFIKNLVPVDVDHVEVEDEGDRKVAKIRADDNRSRIVGKGGKNIQIIKRFLEERV